MIAIVPDPVTGAAILAHPARPVIAIILDPVTGAVILAHPAWPMIAIVPDPVTGAATMIPALPVLQVPAARPVIVNSRSRDRRHHCSARAPFGSATLLRLSPSSLHMRQPAPKPHSSAKQLREALESHLDDSAEVVRPLKSSSRKAPLVPTRSRHDHPRSANVAP